MSRPFVGICLILIYYCVAVNRNLLQTYAVKRTTVFSDNNLLENSLPF